MSPWRIDLGSLVVFKQADLLQGEAQVVEWRQVQPWQCQKRNGQGGRETSFVSLWNGNRNKYYRNVAVSQVIVA